MKDLRQIGMKLESVAGGGETRGHRLIVRNTITGRAWLFDPEDGVGEPLDMTPPSIHASSVRVPAKMPRSGGPHICDWCGERKLFVIRFSETEHLTKCLACRRFVVDGREERPGRGPRNLRQRDSRQQSLSFPVKLPAKATRS